MALEIFKLVGSIFVNTDKAEDSISKTGKKAEGLTGKLVNGITTAGKWAIGISAAAGTVAAAIGVKATSAAIDFQSEMSNVATLLDGDVSTKLNEFGTSVKKLSKDTGATTADLSDGLYQVVSAFGDTADSMGILETAAKGAKAGNASTTDSINLLAAVTKGYGDTSEQAAKKASDLAFNTVKLGQTSFPELASAMGKVIPLASTMKVSQEELFGAMATLTGVTGGTAEVTTQLRGAIQGFMQPTGAMTEAMKKLGFENGQVMLENLGLQGSLEKLKESVGGNEIAFAGLFGSVEAKNAVLALAGSQAENFTEKTKAMYDAVGATDEAFKKQTDNVKASFNKLKNSFNVTLVSLGEKFLPTLQKLLDWTDSHMPEIEMVTTKTLTAISTGIEWVASVCQTVIPIAKDIATIAFNEIRQAIDWCVESFHAVTLWMNDNKPLVETIIIIIGSLAAAFVLVNGAVAIYNGVMAAWNMIGVISTAVTTGFGAAVAFLTSPITLTVLAIGGLIAVVVLLIRHWDDVTAAGARCWQEICNVFGNCKDWFTSNVYAPIYSIFGDVFDGIQKIFGGCIDFITGVFTGNWKKAIGGLGDIVSGVFQAMVGYVKAPMNAIIKLINMSLGKIDFKIPDWIPGLGGKGFSFPTIPMLANGIGLAEKGKQYLLEGAGDEAVIPLSKDRGAITKIANAILSGMDLNNSQSNRTDSTQDMRPVNIIIKVGEIEFAKLAVDCMNKLFLMDGCTLNV